MNNKIVRISALCVLITLCATKEKDSTLNELNEVVIDSKFALKKEKSGKIIVKLLPRN
jgi:vitamin B12 transporter